MNLKEVLNDLKIHGKTIGKQYKDERIKEAELVISYYEMVYTCPGDGMAQTLLIEAYKDWKEKYAK